MNAPGVITDVAESDFGEVAGRLGLATRGVIYLVSAGLTARIATKEFAAVGEEGPGKSGALHAVAGQPFGRVLVGLLAIGLAGYAAWRFLAAATYEGDAADEPSKVWVKRGSYVGKGLAYLVGLATALSLLFADDPGSESSDSADQTRRVFDLPAGRWIIGLVGFGFLIAAGYNGYRAYSGSFTEKWSHDLTETQRKVAMGVSAVGLAGHMLVFVLVGWFLARAAWTFDPSEPEGIDEAAKALADEPYGTTLLIVLALGMFAYAGFSFVEARWRDVLE